MSGVYIVDSASSRILGSREDQEDRYLLLNPGSIKSRKELALYAVFDGHGGSETVNHASQSFVSHLEQHFIKPKDSTPEEYKVAIQRALNAVDRDLDRADLKGGCTVALILVDTRQGLLIEADLGDSHVVFADHQPGSPTATLRTNSVGSSNDDAITSSDPPGWTVENLAVEHSPDNPDERRRVEEAGGEINYSTGIARIGGVNMARALGDLAYKKPRVNNLAGHDLSDLVGVETGLAPGKKAIHDLVSNTAHFTVKRLQGQSLVLLATDGVGGAEDAAEVTRLAVDQWKTGAKLKNIADQLTKREGSAEGADNTTMVLVALDTEKKRRSRSDSVRSSHRGSLEVPDLEGSGGRHRRRSSIARIKDWIRD